MECDKEIQEFRDWVKNGGFHLDTSLFYDIKFDDYEKWNEKMCDSLVMNDRLLIHKNPYIRWRENYKYNFILNLIDVNKDNNILDAGTGTGIILERIKTGNLYGFDLSQKSVDYVNNKLKNKKGFKGVIKAYAQNLPYEDDFFDIIFCDELIEHVRNPRKVLDELDRVLKPNGCLIISTTSKLLNYMKSFVSFFGLSFVLGDSVPLRIPAHIHEFTMKGLKELLRNRMFIIEKSYYFPFKYIGESIIIKVRRKLIKDMDRIHY